jgi:hypothetical protein
MMMRDVGINKVYYSMDNTIICEKITNLISFDSSHSLHHTDMVQHNASHNMVEYYKKIIKKMPTITKRKNAEYLIQSLKFSQFSCTLGDISLVIYFNDMVVGTIIIEN